MSTLPSGPNQALFTYTPFDLLAPGDVNPCPLRSKAVRHSWPRRWASRRCARLTSPGSTGARCRPVYCPLAMRIRRIEGAVLEVPVPLGDRQFEQWLDLPDEAIVGLPGLLQHHVHKPSSPLLVEELIRTRCAGGAILGGVPEVRFTPHDALPESGVLGAPPRAPIQGRCPPMQIIGFWRRRRPQFHGHGLLVDG